MGKVESRYDHLWLVGNQDARFKEAAALVRRRVEQSCHELQQFVWGDHAFWEYLCQASAGPAVALGATFGDQAVLDHAVIIHERPSRGFLLVELAWKALQPMGRDYTVFVHLVDGGGRLVAQHDGPPAGGSRPTTSWESGGEIRDLHLIPLPPGIADGRYALWVGLYDADGRLALQDATTFAVAGQVEIIGGHRDPSASPAAPSVSSR
jgi:hypothetical protein